MRPPSWSAVLLALLAAGASPRSSVRAQAIAEGAPVVTLGEARRRAASIDPVTVGARGDVDAATWERRAARADVLLPRVTAGLDYIHFSDPFFNFGTGSISPNAASATLQASYSLLGAGKLGALRRSSASLASAEANETAATFRTAFTTDAAYYAVLADRELARVASERLRRATEQFGVARSRVLAGDAIASDSLQLLLEMNRSRFAVLQSDSALVASRLRLGRQVGLTGPAEAAPVDTATPPELPLSLDAAIAELRARGPEVEAARALERRADATLLSEREEYLPDVTLSATTGAYDARLFPSALRRTQFAVAVSVPLWDGGQREVGVARARADRELARAERRERERGAAAAMAEAYHGYRTSRGGIALASTGVAVATEAFRVQRARYREGATTILDLLEAQVALSEAEAALVQSRYATRLALARVESLLGRRLLDASEAASTVR